jgi:hypothetical protein
MKIMDLALNHVGLLIFIVIIVVALMMLINTQVMLQGLSTGMGVILAQKLWESFEKYRKKITKTMLNEA